jgi:hypothetical protein
MAWKRVLYYGIIALGALFVVSVVVSVISTILSLAWAAISAAVSLAVLVGIVYVAYQAVSWFSDGADTADRTGRPEATTADESPADRQDRLRRQYVEGQISEVEFERRIARELEAEDDGDIERELEREY